MREGSGYEEPSAGAARAPVLALLALMAALFAWWSWSQGAYFDGVFYPGAIGLCVVAALLLLFAPPPRPRGLPLVALASILGLALLTTISMLWSDVPSAALECGGRVFAYAALFFVGLWVGSVVRDRADIALIPIALAGAFLAIATLVELSVTTDMAWMLHDDGTLRFPIGYRNANATMFLLFAWPLAAIAIGRRRHWAIRAGSVAGATCLIELAVLAQSRGSVPAALAAVAVLLLVSPRRLRTVWILALIAIPVAIAIPDLLAVFQHGTNDASAVPVLRDAARLIAVTSAFSFGLAAFAFVVLDEHVRPSPGTQRQVSVVLLVVALIGAVVLAGAFFARSGGPVEFVEQRVDEFTTVGYPDLSDQDTRYGANVGSNRGDFWRVSLLAGRDSPILGTGAGSFHTEYLRERSSWETPQNPHSVEMLMLSELGIAGVALLFAFVGTAAAATLRRRQSSVAAGLVCAGILAAATQWFVHASYDWFWLYPGVTGPAVFLLGVGAAVWGANFPSLEQPSRTIRRPVRIAGVAVAAVIAVGCLSLYLSDRYLGRALDSGVASQAAINDLERSADFAPLASQPLTERARIELERGDPAAARVALEEALDREPADFEARYLLARIAILTRAPDAKAQLERARELNPNEEALQDLAAR